MNYLKVRCKPCNTVFIAMSDRHRMDYCPKCEENYVDLEEVYMRATMNIEVVESFKPPWFKDEDEYHSALLSWLNDSDETFRLYKEDGILYVVKL